MLDKFTTPQPTWCRAPRAKWAWFQPRVPRGKRWIPSGKVEGVANLCVGDACHRSCVGVGIGPDALNEGTVPVHGRCTGTEIPYLPAKVVEDKGQNPRRPRRGKRSTGGFVVAVHVVVIRKHLRPVRSDVGVRPAHGFLLVVAFLGVASNADGPRWTGGCVLNRRRRRVIGGASVNFVVHDNGLVGSCFNAGNGQGTGGAKGRGDDVNQGLVPRSQDGCSRETLNEENHRVGVCIEHRSGRSPFRDRRGVIENVDVRAPIGRGSDDFGAQ